MCTLLRNPLIISSIFLITFATIQTTFGESDVDPSSSLSPNLDVPTLAPGSEESESVQLSSSQMFTTTTDIPTTDSAPHSSTKKTLKKRAKSNSTRKYGSTTDSTTDSDSSGDSDSDSESTELTSSSTLLPNVKGSTTESSTTSENPDQPAFTPGTETTTSTITSVPFLAQSSTLASEVTPTATTLESIPSDTTTSQVKTSTVSSSSSSSTTIKTDGGSTEPGETSTGTSISSSSTPSQTSDSSILESTNKSDEDPENGEGEGPSQEVDEQVAWQPESSDAPQQCVATVPRLNLHLEMMLGEWYPARLSDTTSKLWSQSLEKGRNNSDAGCFLMDYSMPEDDPDILQINLSRQEESAQVEALFVGDDHHPRESKWAITWPNGEDTLTSVVAAGVILASGGKKGQEEKNGDSSSPRYAWLLTVDCDLNGIVEPDWAVMARVREGISNATLSTILAIVEGLKGLRVDNAITFQSEDCHKKN